LTDKYATVVGWALDHRKSMVALAIAAFFGAIVLQQVAGGAGFVPLTDRGEIEVIVEAPPSASLEFTTERTEAIAAIARRHPEVLYTYSVVGTPLPMRTPGVDQSNIYIRLNNRSERKLSQAELGEIMRREFQQVAGVNTAVFTGGFGGAFKELQLQLRGPDATVLAQLGDSALQLARTVPGAVDVGLSARGAREELAVEIDRGLAGAMGLTVGQVGMAMRVAFAGIDAGDWVDPTGRTRDVRVRLSPEARQRAIDLERLPLTVYDATGRARTVPLGQVARVTRQPAPAQIDHLDRQRVITLEANTHGRPLNSVTLDMKAALSKLNLPPGYSISEGGWN